MMGQGGYIPALRQTRERLSVLLQSLDTDAGDTTGLVSTYRALVNELDNILAFLQPCSNDNESRFLKALDSSLDEDGRNSIDAEVAAAIVELQQEACDAVMFLEGVAQLAESSHAFINGDPEHRNSLVVQQNSLRNDLIARQKELDATRLDNASNLDHLDTNIAAAVARIRQLRTASKSSNHNAGHSSAYVDDETAHQRSIEATRLLSAMETSPLKVIEEGPDYIVYEYTLGDTTTRLRVGDDHGEMHFLLEPMDPKAHAYLKQHLHGCKSRSQIAAVMQEALTLP